MAASAMAVTFLISGYHMSRMLHLYGTADSRVVALGGAIRRWARGHGLTSPHAGRWLTNFSLTLMVLTYLMTTSPPVLLPLSVLKVIPGEDEESGQPIFIVPQQSASAAAAAAAQNTDPLETLLKGFFEYYDNFNFRERGMSIVTGRDFVKPAHCAIYIQNPLERDLNVSRNVTLEEVERLRSEVTHARFLLEGEEDGTETGPGTEQWGALRLWLRGTLPMTQRHNEGCAIDWRAVFHPKDKAVPKGVPGNRKGTQELPGLVSKLKQKALSKKSQNGRYTRKGKLQY